jgi:hypothetical protein
MNIVQGDLTEEKAASLHRGGSAKYAYLLDGDPGSPIDNYSLVLTRTPGRFSPRHRHNFEQFRFQIEGTANYGRTGKLKPGMLGYFPEGVHYGPQTQEDNESLTMLVLQCGGASGSGYPGRAAINRAQGELRQKGTFKDGVFHRNAGEPGKRNLDGFQAIWEHINQRSLVYPKPRYDVPILIYPENFQELPVEGTSGVFEKRLGMFTEGRSEAGIMQLDKGASYRATGQRDIFVALSGQGRVGGEPLRRFTTVFLDFGEKVDFQAEDEVQMLRIRLPDLRHVTALEKAKIAAE